MAQPDQPKRAPGDPRPGLCVFDIDNTLLRGPASTEAICGPLPMKPVCKDCLSFEKDPYTGFTLPPIPLYAAPYAKQAVRDCLNMGYNVAVSTAEACPGMGTPDSLTVKSRYDFLRELGFPSDVVDASGKMGPGLQCRDPRVSAYGEKGPQVLALTKHYGSDPKKVMFFDDQLGYRQDVGRSNPQAILGQASRNCGGEDCLAGCGLQKNDFDDAMKQLRLAKKKSI